MNDRITAVFDSEMHAEQAIRDLRSQGVTDDQLSVVARRGESADTTGGGATAESMENRDEADDTASRAGKGLLAGAGVGTLFGLAAALIPGVGPFITAGWLASVLGATAGGAVSGAIVGGTAGAVAGALSKAGYAEDEARFYGDAIERGDTLVAVDLRNSTLSADQIRSIMRQHGGRFAGADVQQRAA